MPGMVMGTAAYLSPEQVKGNPADIRTDIWAFGCVLYQMLSGRRPFDSNSVPEILAGILRDDPRDLSVVNPEVPISLVELVNKCLAKDPLQRPQSAQEIALNLKAILSQMRSGTPEAVAAKPVAPVMPEEVVEAPGRPGLPSVETLNRYLKMIAPNYPLFALGKKGPGFVEVNHHGTQIGILLTSKPNYSSDFVAFIAPLFTLPADQLAPFYRRLLVLSNGHTDVAQFALDHINRRVNLTCVRQSSHMDYREFLYTLDTISALVKGLAMPLKSEFGSL